ncbi:MAG: hypothetical protein WCG20_01555 [bacterium]
MSTIGWIALFAILIALNIYLQDRNSKQPVKTITDVEEAIKEYLGFAKENSNSNQLREKATTLEKRLGLCKQLITIQSLHEQNPMLLVALGIDRYRTLGENTEFKAPNWNYWNTDILKEKDIILIYENIIKAGDVLLSRINNEEIKPSYMLLFSKDSIALSRIIKYSSDDLFGDTKKVFKKGLSGEYEDLLRFSIEQDSYKIETFHPGEWTIELVDCFNLFSKNFNTWNNKMEKINNWVDIQKFSPDKK